MEEAQKWDESLEWVGIPGEHAGKAKGIRTSTLLDYVFEIIGEKGILCTMSS